LRKKAAMNEEYSVDDPTQLLEAASEFALYPGTYNLFYFSFFAFSFNFLIFGDFILVSYEIV
jgi:hypothetical protein